MAFFNESKFNMWRACIGAIWIDGELDVTEEKWISEKINNLPFTEEQRETLRSDLKGNIDFDQVLANITDKKDRAFLAHQMRVIGHLDQDFSQHEKDLYESWNKLVLKGVDLEALEKIIEEDEKASYHEDEVYKVNNRHSIFERVHRSVQRALNPGDYKFPEEK